MSGAEPEPQPTRTRRVIVAEITQTYDDGIAREVTGFPTGISRRFEVVIDTNDQRGYDLADWRFSQVLRAGEDSGPRMESEDVLVETIVATFVIRPQSFSRGPG